MDAGPTIAGIDLAKGRDMTACLTVYGTPDALPEPLKEFCTTNGDGPFNTWFRHPMLVDMFPICVGLPLEDVLKIRQDAADAMYDTGNFEAYVFRHERVFRMNTLLELVTDGIFDGSAAQAKRFWRLAAQVWVDAEFDESDPIWTTLIDIDIPHRREMSGSDGKKRLKALGSTFTVYRGVQGPNLLTATENVKSGWAWTTQRHTAEFFAKRYKAKGDTAYVASATVNVRDVVAHLVDRGEAEILIRPGTEINGLKLDRLLT